MDETLIVGIGDEIVLFIVFVFISLIFVFFMTRRRNLTGAVATGAATGTCTVVPCMIAFVLLGLPIIKIDFVYQV